VSESLGILKPLVQVVIKGKDSLNMIKEVGHILPLVNIAALKNGSGYRLHQHF